MSFNSVPALAAGGNIYPMRFLKMGTTSHQALQAGLGDSIIGISGTGIIDSRSDAENLYHAQAGQYAANLVVRGFGDADVPLAVGAAWSVGDVIGSDADGKGIPVYSGNGGAIAMEAATGSTNENRRVWILPQGFGGIGNVVAASADGAITATRGTVFITKSSAAALTLSAPATSDNGKELMIVGTTPFAHTVTLTGGFNSSGSNFDVATFDLAVRGATMRLVAYQGVWYATILKSVTLG